VKIPDTNVSGIFAFFGHLMMKCGCSVRRPTGFKGVETLSGNF
jgi:hypothetical protein